ncbi:CXXX repeat peptide modification system protein [Acidilutibacter cellobiosedens]|jgi:CXXX repeat modification system protein|uniref:CXXX repeat peptide modification system protein n=1 Tax=Acidilutibacter cellobiosedens TaxID=2507161 RepID=A0A410QBT4_9FIRM|nr:CXXX repeat peptide modification system protein [Acidilutibacter cellobiosedens]QAT61441.1 CXXX repeat peptide modification system protein [Acidilutibacter cellobiosedens]
MDQKVVWELSEEDSNEIQDLFERKIALENLVKIVDLKDSDIYEKLLKDYGKTIREFEDWWKTKSSEYKWEGSNWWVDFTKNQVLTKV